MLPSKEMEKEVEATSHFGEDTCQFAYIRVITGDEQSKRAKLPWCAFYGKSWAPSVLLAQVFNGF